MKHTRELILKHARAYKELSENLERLATRDVCELVYVQNVYDLAREAMIQISNTINNYPQYVLITALQRDVEE